jgi:hypothetical protein
MKKILAYLLPWLFAEKLPGGAGVTLQQLKQDEKNRQFVSNIITGHYGLPVDKTLRKLQCDGANAAFKKWQETQKHMIDTAPSDRHKTLKKYMKAKKFYEFFPKYTQEVPSDNEYELFLKDAFTEPFPSLHDMPEWAIGTQMTTIMVMYGISELDARHNYCIREKAHFVNHDMTSGIIWFDLYIKKSNKAV